MRNDEGLGRWVPARDDVAVAGLVGLLYLEHLIYGANRADLSLFFAVIHLVLLLLLLVSRSGRRAVQSAPLALPGALLAVILAAAAFSVLPLGGVIGHPLWSYVGQAAGSASLDPVATRLEMVKLTGLGALFVLALAVGAKRERADRFVQLLSYAGGAYAAWAFLTWTENPSLIFGVVRPYGGDRLSGSFLSANSAATLFACQAMLQLCLLIRAIRRAPGPLLSRRSLSEMKGAPTAAILLFVNGACLILTASRGGLLAAVAAGALVVACFAFVRTDARSAVGGLALVGGLVAFVAVALLFFTGSRLLGRVGDNPMADLRFPIFAAYWRMVLASPWWGYGMGAFHAFNFQSMTEANAVAMSTLGAAHNVYLQWLLQSGLMGFLPMMALMAVIVAVLVKGLRRRARQQAVIVFALATCAIFAIHGAMDYALEEPSMTAFFAVVLGLGYGVSTRA